MEGRPVDLWIPIEVTQKMGQARIDANGDMAPRSPHMQVMIGRFVRYSTGGFGGYASHCIPLNNVVSSTTQLPHSQPRAFAGHRKQRNIRDLAVMAMVLSYAGDLGLLSTFLLLV